MSKYKLLHTQNIIAKVARDFKIINSSWTYDAVEWIGEAIEAMGVYETLSPCSVNITIHSHKTRIPCNLDQLRGIVYRNRRLPNISDVDTFKDYEPLRNLDTCTQNWYSTNPQYIETSFEKGDITIHFLSIPVDEKGFPMVVDNYFVREGISFYILMKTLGQGYKHPVFKYPDAEERWENLMVKAINDMKMPNEDEMALFANVWLGIKGELSILDFTRDIQRNVDNGTTYAASTSLINNVNNITWY